MLPHEKAYKQFSYFPFKWEQWWCLDHNAWPRDGKIGSTQQLSDLGFFNFLPAMSISPSSVQSWSKASVEEGDMLDRSIVIWCSQDQEGRTNKSEGATRDMGIQDNIAEMWRFTTT